MLGAVDRLSTAPYESGSEADLMCDEVKVMRKAYWEIGYDTQKLPQH